jgi:HEAT repeat protein
MTSDMTAQVGKWLAQLHEQDPDVRWSAFEALKALGRKDEEAVRCLTLELENDQSSHRCQVIWILEDIGAPAASSAPALACLIDEDDDLRIYAVLALASIGVADTTLVAKLRRLLEDRDLCVRAASASALLRLAPPSQESLEALQWLSLSSGFGVHLWAVSGMERAAPTVPEVRPSLVGALVGRTDEIMESAALALAKCEPQEVIPLLLRALRQGPPNLRRGVLYTLRELGQRAQPVTSSITETLLKVGVFDDDDPAVRRSAANAAAAVQLDSKEVVEKLKKLLADTDGWVRERAAAALLKLERVAPEEKHLAAELLLKNEVALPEEKRLAELVIKSTSVQE